MSRRLPAFLAMLGLLFAQVTLAAYACPIDLGAPPAWTMTDCAEHAMPASADKVCEFRCEAGVSLPGSPQRDVPILAAPSLTVAVQTLQVPRYAAPAKASLRDMMATAPPVAIRFCRLLI